MSEAYDRIGFRNFSLGGMTKGFCTMIWAPRHDTHDDDGDAEGPLLLPPPSPMRFEERLDHLESMIKEGFEAIDNRFKELNLKHYIYDHQMIQM